MVSPTFASLELLEYCCLSVDRDVHTTMTTKRPVVAGEKERAVSPVIGVILMVAITVILAAVIAAFVLDLGQSTGANASAGINFDQDSSAETVRVTISSVDRADTIEVRCVDNTEELEFAGPSAGDTIVVDYSSGANSGDLDCDGETSLQVIGTLSGNDAIIATYDIN